MTHDPRWEHRRDRRQVTHRCACTCGWLSPWRVSRTRLVLAYADHLGAVRAGLGPRGEEPVPVASWGVERQVKDA